MAVNGSSTDANGDQLLVSIQSPYENVVEVLSFTDSITPFFTIATVDLARFWSSAPESKRNEPF